ncbi:MAG TPA: peptidylprolyl isomerase [Fimbriimonadaceae bacterium]|nr:peptidylprolyl isomerase [Fimbriimonadaceae bacterium]
MRLFLAIILGFLSLGFAPTQGNRSSQNDASLKIAIEGKGTIVIKLFMKEAPKACNHIAQLARQGFYDGQRFFRVTRSPRPYIAQVGDPASRNGVDGPNIGQGSTGAKIPYEDSGHHNDKYAVGLAALLSKDRDSGDCQFYIVLGDGNSFLDGSYTVFGHVTAGFDVVDHLEKGDKITNVTVG